MVDLGRKLERLERVQPAARVPKFVRLCVSDEDEVAARLEATTAGIRSAEVLLFRLAPPCAHTLSDVIGNGR